MGTPKYMQVRTGIYRRCSHENTIKILEKNYNCIKFCWKCGTFWHVLGKHEYSIVIASKHIKKYVLEYVYPVT